jgi:putative FmdB family regulatory protein
VPALAYHQREGGSVPTYQYTCTECGEQVEAVQKFSDEPLSVCTNCGGRLRKVFSPVGIVFKGSGFYRTDSRSGNSSATPAKAKEPSSSNGDSSAASTDSAGKADKPDKKSSDKVSTSTTGSSSSSSSEKVA